MVILALPNVSFKVGGIGQSTEGLKFTSVWDSEKSRRDLDMYQLKKRVSSRPSASLQFAETANNNSPSSINLTSLTSQPAVSITAPFMVFVELTPFLISRAVL